MPWQTSSRSCLLEHESQQRSNIKNLSLFPFSVVLWHEAIATVLSPLRIVKTSCWHKLFLYNDGISTDISIVIQGIADNVQMTLMLSVDQAKVILSHIV